MGYAKAMTAHHNTLRPFAVHSGKARIGVAALLAAAALTLTACSGNGTASIAETSWGNLKKQGEPFVTFEKDGKVHGNDGCNVMNGEWTEKDGTVTFSPLATTMMFCEGVDTWLSGSATAVTKGDKITFSDDQGKEIGSLNKTDFESSAAK